MKTQVASALRTERARKNPTPARKSATENANSEIGRHLGNQLTEPGCTFALRAGEARLSVHLLLDADHAEVRVAIGHAPGNEMHCFVNCGRKRILSTMVTASVAAVGVLAAVEPYFPAPLSPHQRAAFMAIVSDWIVGQRLAAAHSNVGTQTL